MEGSWVRRTLRGVSSSERQYPQLTAFFGMSLGGGLVASLKVVQLADQFSVGHQPLHKLRQWPGKNDASHD